MTTNQYKYRPTYNAHGQHDGINPVRVYPVVHEYKQAMSKGISILLALGMIVLACGFVWAVVAFGANL